MATQVQVKKWGSSMAVLIPRHFARMRRIDIGSVIDLDSVKVVRARRARYKLSELMAQFKTQHRHGEWQLEEKVGKEIW